MIKKTYKKSLDEKNKETLFVPISFVTTILTKENRF